MNNPKLSNQIAGSTPPSLTPFDQTYPTHDFEFTYQDNCDATHPLNLDYFMPVNLQRLITARLSFKLRLYRTYSSFSVTATGNESVQHTHGINSDSTGSSGHTHNHTHGLGITVGALGTGVFLLGGALTSTNAPPDATSLANAQAESGHSHAHNHGSPTTNDSVGHTHTVSGSSFLGITDGTVAAGVTISFDGGPTGLIGDPFSTDQVELDVTSLISSKVDRAWHLIALQPSGLGRIQGILRLLYSSNPT